MIEQGLPTGTVSRLTGGGGGVGESEKVNKTTSLPTDTIVR